jgi:hypothetical protein
MFVQDRTGSQLHSRSLATLFITALMAFALSRGSVCASSTSCWQITQKHKLNGKQVLFVGENKWRLENKDLGYDLIADASTGTINVFNKSKKLRFKSPFANFDCTSVRLFRVVSGEELKDLKWKPLPRKDSAPVATSYYQAETERTCFRGSPSGGYLAGTKYIARIRYTMAISNQIKMQPELAKVLSDFQGTPDLGGVPLREIIEFSDKPPTKNIDTLAIKHMNTPAQIWKVPDTYKETVQIGDVVTSGDSTLLEDFTENLIH